MSPLQFRKKIPRNAFLKKQLGRGIGRRAPGKFKGNSNYRASHKVAVAVIFSFSCLLKINLDNAKLLMGESKRSNLGSEDHLARLQPKVYDVQDMPEIQSSGPKAVNPELGGVFEFNNVCVTKHFKDADLQGLLYLMPGNESLAKNDGRCIPCAAPLNQAGGWWGRTSGNCENAVQHTCGFEGTHAMYATNVSDWSSCMKGEKAKRMMAVWNQYQLPSHVESVHFYEEPIFSFQFQENIGHSLFDTLLTYLPHWYKYQANRDFPFRGVYSNSLEGCLSKKNTDWFCEVVRTMEMFGDARELPPKPNNTTLYCYKSISISHLAWNRQLRHKVITKEMFDSMRDRLFQGFSLPRDRSIHGETKRIIPNRRLKILFYAHEPSGRRVWEGMNSLINDAKDKARYKNVDFDIVHDFGGLRTREQAVLFNSYDAFIMAHGAQMANSIFAVDKSIFLELGCRVPSFIGNPDYVALIDGHHQVIQSCGPNVKDKACVMCEQGGIYANFTTTQDAFESMIDTVMQKGNQLLG